MDLWEPCRDKPKILDVSVKSSLLENAPIPARDGRHSKWLQVELNRNQLFTVMQDLHQRKISFKDRWGDYPNINSEELANLGFFYPGVGDYVVCYSCGGKIKYFWCYTIPDSIVDHTHRGKNPECDAIKRYVESKSKMITGMKEHLRFDAVPGRNTQPQFKGQNACHLAVDEDVYFFSNPQTPEMCSEEHRRNTLNGKENLFLCDVDQVAQAGFFSDVNATNDLVKCYWCTGTLEKWERNDDPWKEHARQFPQCSYVRKMRGTYFILRSRQNVQQSMLNSHESLIYCRGDGGFLSDHEYFREEKRLRSLYPEFKDTLRNISSAAKSGLYNTGFPSEVACFFCGFKISADDVEENEDLEDLHNRMSGTCVRRTRPDDCGDVPFGRFFPPGSGEGGEFDVFANRASLETCPMFTCIVCYRHQEFDLSRLDCRYCGNGREYWELLQERIGIEESGM